MAAHFLLFLKHIKTKGNCNFIEIVITMKVSILSSHEYSPMNNNITINQLIKITLISILNMLIKNTTKAIKNKLKFWVFFIILFIVRYGKTLLYGRL